MLATLRIQNFAIIDKLEVEFHKGLNVITGETGAGKSILIDALTCILGGRVRADIVRTGADSAEVEGLFELQLDSPIHERLLKLGIPYESAVIVRRVIQSGGRTKAYVNGRMVTASDLAVLAEGLVNISSQHEHHSLVMPKTHLVHLDAVWVKQSKHANTLLEAYGQAYRTMTHAQAALVELENQVAHRSDRMDYLRFQLNEIEALSLKPNEELDLKDKRDRMKHAERLARAALHAEEILVTRDGAISEALASIDKSLADAARIDPQLLPHLESLRQASSVLSDLSRDLGVYGRKVVFDPHQLDALEERWHAIQKLKRKHPQGIDTFVTQAKVELEKLEHHEDTLQTLKLELAQATEKVHKLAQALSKERKSAAQKLNRAVTEELRTLGMTNAAFQVALDTLPQPGPTGCERVEFLIAPNPGEAPKPLAKVASGGELSRTMLAIKRVLTSSDAFEMFVFDEVDAGVGGAIAEVIGRKLYEVSRTHQVLCITHLPQIAVFADEHLVVRKQAREGRTYSEITPLKSTDIAEEIARMLGGIKITDKTRAAAKEMLKDARVNPS